MTIIFSIIIIILILLKYILFVDIILSWVNLRITFISEIMNPLYKLIKDRITTNIGPLDFTPIIILIIIMFLNYFLIPFTGENAIKLSQINNYFL